MARVWCSVSTRWRDGVLSAPLERVAILAVGLEGELRGGARATIIIHEHTRVGTRFHCTVLGTAHCPALKPGIGILGIASSGSINDTSSLAMHPRQPLHNPACCVLNGVARPVLPHPPHLGSDSVRLCNHLRATLLGAIYCLGQHRVRPNNFRPTQPTEVLT